MIGVASLVGSAACLPSFDQPAAQNTVANPNTPGTTAVQGTGDNGVVAPLSPSQQTAIWMQGGDPSLLANRAYDEGPIEVASQKHSCEKMKFDIIGKLLMGRGVAITSGTNPASLPVTATSTCPGTSAPNTDTAAFVYCTSRLTLGLPQYAARLGEATTISSGTGTKMMDLYATAATEIEKSLVAGTNAFPASATNCKEQDGSMAIMFGVDPNNASNLVCKEAGVTCLQGYPATADQVALCSSVITQAVAQTGSTQLQMGRRLAIATVLAGSEMCE